MTTDALQAVLTQPTPAHLWQLRGALRVANLPGDRAVWQTIDRFYTFLNELSAQVKSHEYSKMASLLDIGAVGGVAIQGLLAGDLPVADLWKKVIAGSLGESLMVLASRQYIKGTAAEIDSVYHAAAWYLFDGLWQMSAQMQPEQETAVRRELLDRLLAPALSPETDDAVKIVLLTRLFQLLLLTQLHEAQA